MSVTFQYEELRDCIDGIIPLMEDHHQEVIGNKRKLDIDFDKYFELADAGYLHITTTRDGKKVVGYVICMLSPNLHYKDHVFAITDSLYLHPDYRVGWNAMRLLRSSKCFIKNSGGVSSYRVNMPINHPFRPLMARLGAQLNEENWEVIL